MPEAIERGDSQKKVEWYFHDFLETQNTIAETEWPAEALQHIFRKEGVTREWIRHMHAMPEASALDRVLDIVLGFRKAADEVHIKSFEANNFDNSVWKEKQQELMKADLVMIRGTAGYMAMTTSYIDLIGIMDVLRTPTMALQANPNFVSTRKWFDGVGFEGKVFADLGSGYPRMGAFLGLAYPGLRYTGYEIDPLRVEFCKQTTERLKLTNVSYVRQDLADQDFLPQIADYYFLYDPCGVHTQNKIFQDLKILSFAYRTPIRIVGISGWSPRILNTLDQGTRDGWLVKLTAYQTASRYQDRVIWIAETVVK